MTTHYLCHFLLAAGPLLSIRGLSDPVVVPGPPSGLLLVPELGSGVLGAVPHLRLACLDLTRGLGEAAYPGHFLGDAYDVVVFAVRFKSVLRGCENGGQQYQLDHTLISTL